MTAFVGLTAPGAVDWLAVLSLGFTWKSRQGRSTL
jgi:hypothetical protein